MRPLHHLLHSAATLVLMVVTCAACSDEEEVMWTPADRSRTLELILSDAPLAVRAVAEETATEAATATAAEDNDPEYYIGTVDLKFFVGTDTTATPLYTCQLKREKYRTDTALVRLASDTVAMLFPDGATTCTLYALANAPAADATGDIVSTPLPMDGYTTITLDRRHMTMSGSVTLVRRVAKVAVRLLLPASISVEGETYVPAASPAPTAELLYKGQSATAEFAVSSSSSDGAKSAEAYTTYGHTPFYVYPSSWGSDYTTDVPSVRLAVAWQPAAGGNASTFYYEFPVSYDSTRLLRNYAYVMEVSLNRAGSRVKNEPMQMSASTLCYEVLEWMKEDTKVSNEWNQSHYLLTGQSQYTLRNSSDLDISYSTCATLDEVYLTDISCKSTLDLQTLHLYRTNGGYSEAEAAARKQVGGDPLTHINITNTPSYLSTGEFLNSGTIRFTADVQQLAAKLYSPITYTLVLVGQEEHEGLKREVTITQWPANYIDFSSGDDVFVNGYYSLLTTNGEVDGARENSDRYYSYSQVSINYTSVKNNDQYTGYYYSFKVNPLNWDTNKLISKGITNFGTGIEEETEYVRTGYESLCKDLSTINFEWTTDVHISALTEVERTFKLNSTDVRNRIIGDPRVSGAYTSIDHTSSSSSDNQLDDYLVKGFYEYTRNTFLGITLYTEDYYYRYVKTWGTDAAKIQVGGDDENIIAPEYKIQSDYGITYEGTDLTTARKRCATYQEGGYSAGRWRLPTVAELAYVMQLQIDGVIDAPFTKGTAYMTASGASVAVNSEQIDYTQNATSAAVRCVYDLWAWGNQPTYPIAKFHPEP